MKKTIKLYILALLIGVVTVVGVMPMRLGTPDTVAMEGVGGLIAGANELTGAGDLMGGTKTEVDTEVVEATAWEPMEPEDALETGSTEVEEAPAPEAAEAQPGAEIAVVKNVVAESVVVSTPATPEASEAPAAPGAPAVPETPAEPAAPAVPANNVQIGGQALELVGLPRTSDCGDDSGTAVYLCRKMLYAHDAIFAGITQLSAGARFTVAQDGVTATYEVARTVIYDVVFDESGRRLGLATQGGELDTGLMSAVAYAQYKEGLSYDVYDLSMMTCYGARIYDTKAQRFVVFARKV